MHSYSAYGLNICSELPLPELQPSSPVEADVVIRVDNINWSSPESSRAWSYFHIDGEDAYLGWEVVGKFLVRSGKEIIIDPLPSVEERVIRLPLLGAVLAMLLHQQRHLVLHASAVAVNGSAAVFMGPKGQGKSTMVATLYGRGHKLIADDVTPLDMSDPSSPILIPGFPQIKLWPEAAVAALSDNPETLTRVHPEAEKRARPTLDNFLQSPLPLTRVYMLSEGPNLQIKPLKPQDALVSLIANSYIPSLLGNQFLHSATAPFHFHQCTELVKNLSVYSLERPRSLNLLSDVAKLVEDDLDREPLAVGI